MCEHPILRLRSSVKTSLFRTDRLSGFELSGAPLEIAELRQTSENANGVPFAL
jgi:hypothetical protein